MPTFEEDVATIAAVRALHPALTWAGWYDPAGMLGGTLESLRAEMTEPHCVAQFRRAAEFISHSQRLVRVNMKRGCYGWKHDAERFARRDDEDREGYVGEGMFIAAAIAAGLTVRRIGGSTFVNLAKTARWPPPPNLRR